MERMERMGPLEEGNSVSRNEMARGSLGTMRIVVIPSHWPASTSMTHICTGQIPSLAHSLVVPGKSS